MVDAAEDAAMAAGRAIAAGPRIDLRDFARGKDLLLLQDDNAAAIAALLVGPDLRFDPMCRIDDVVRPVIADLALRALRRIAANRQGRVDDESEPVRRLLDRGTALGEDRAVIFAARHHL